MFKTISLITLFSLLVCYGLASCFTIMDTENPLISYSSNGTPNYTYQYVPLTDYILNKIF